MKIRHSLQKVFILPLSALIVALSIGGILIWAGGSDVRAAYIGLFEGVMGSKSALVETCVAATPFILLGLAVALAFKAGLFNIGAEGQFYMGALGSTWVGFTLVGLPMWIHLPLCLATGFMGGLLWGSLPGLLKARYGAHEVITTIMLNYIALSLVDYLVKQVLRDPGATLDRTPFIQAGARLPLLLGPDYRLHAGFILALILAVVVYLFINRTTFGFELRLVGANPMAARYAGINPSYSVVLAMSLSGGIAGLAGAGEVLGLKHNLPALFSSGYGFDSIAVALLAKSNPIGVIPAAFLWGGLRSGSGLMQIRSGISSDLIHVIQALVIVFLAADPIIRFLYRFPVKLSTIFRKNDTGDSRP